MHTHPTASTAAYSPTRRVMIQPQVVLNAGIFGTVVGSTVAMGANLHKVRNDSMGVGQAVGDSLARGAGTGVAAAVATAAVQSVGGTRWMNWAVMLAAATGVGYAIHAVGKKSDSAEQAS